MAGVIWWDRQIFTAIALRRYFKHDRGTQNRVNEHYRLIAALT